MVGPERPAVDKLLAEEVLVPDVKAAEDLNLRPLATAPAALGTSTVLHAPHQLPNLTFGELIVPSVGYRQPEPIKPVRAANFNVRKSFRKLASLARKYLRIGCSVT